jgi:hypothetical protein
MGAEVIIQKQIIIEQPMVYEFSVSDHQIGYALDKSLFKIERGWDLFEKFI